MKVGLIGLGRMEAAMAGSLLQAGHEVTVFDRTANKAQGLINSIGRQSDNSPSMTPA
jgi:3-hydroxyisobutyrate dehydrogenase-like beta-hydroxyacid dehydrogenase